MPYFKDVDTLEIVTRQHQINAEVIDGLIEPIGDDLCYIVAHVPNKKMGWDLKPIDKLTPKSALEKTIQLGKETEKGRPFYRAVLVQDLKEYSSLNEDYYLLNDSLITSAAKSSKKVIENEEVKEVSDRKNTSNNTSENKRQKYKPALYRDKSGEKPLRGFIKS